MSKVKQNIEQVTKLVNESVSSVFSKEDVIKLLKRIDETSTDEVNDKIEVSREWLIDKIESARDSAISDVDSLSLSDVCDLDDIELTLEGREIQIDTSSIYFDAGEVTDTINNSFSDIIDEINNL